VPPLLGRGRLLACTLVPLWVGGCTLAPVHTRPDAWLSKLPPQVYLADVAFFPQEAYQCGPAALATALSASGVTPDLPQLSAEVYVPGMKGSLQPELVAVVRRYGRVPYQLPPSLGDLLTEVAAGHPVIVLQNLGLSWLPRWHYAVVVGYDLPGGSVSLRSGRTPQLMLALETFQRTWARGGQWAMVVTRPERLPSTAEEGRYLEQLIDLEGSGALQPALAGYRAALTRWPASLVAEMGLGNTLFALGRYREAAEVFGAAARRHPDSDAAANNLAVTLAELGCKAEALQAAERASARQGPSHAELQHTLAEIQLDPERDRAAYCSDLATAVAGG
jgi:hypothetical protein